MIFYDKKDKVLPAAPGSNGTVGAIKEELVDYYKFSPAAAAPAEQ